MEKPDLEDDECICKCNWREIIKDTQHLIDSSYKNREGEECIFYGVVWGSDDFYYGMWNVKTGKSSLLSCVGSIEGHGYEKI